VNVVQAVLRGRDGGNITLPPNYCNLLKEKAQTEPDMDITTHHDPIKQEKGDQV
jgi:hypothetical protein